MIVELKEDEVGVGDVGLSGYLGMQEEVQVFIGVLDR